MTKYRVSPTGRETGFGEEDIIVSKTDEKGRITYANDVFLRVSGFEEAELIGAPHSIVRHPDMPRCVFKLIWDRIATGREIFGYVLNMAKNGDHYWVFAHVTPTFGADGRITGYHSMRRKPDAAQIEQVRPLYAALRREEERHADRKTGMHAGSAMLADVVRGKGIEYDEFVFSL